MLTSVRPEHVPAQSLVHWMLPADPEARLEQFDLGLHLPERVLRDLPAERSCVHPKEAEPGTVVVDRLHVEAALVPTHVDEQHGTPVSPTPFERGRFAAL